MNKHCIATLLSLLSLTLSFQAQTPKEAAPPGNPVQFPKGNISWTITVSFKPAKNQAPDAVAPTNGRMKKMEVTQVDDVQRKVIFWLDGKTTERWHFNKAAATIFTDTTNGTPAYIADDDKWGALWLGTGYDAQSFQWINPGNYQGTVSYEGKKCFYYKALINLGQNRSFLGENESFNAFSQETFEAWIDKETFLPVGLSDDAKVGLYTFAKSPANGPLVPPKAIQKTFEQYTLPLIPPKR